MKNAKLFAAVALGAFVGTVSGWLATFIIYFLFGTLSR